MLHNAFTLCDTQVRARCGDKWYRQNRRPKATVSKGDDPKGLKFCNIPKGIEVALTSPKVSGAALPAGAQKPVCYSTWRPTFLHPNVRRCSSKTTQTSYDSTTALLQRVSTTRHYSLCVRRRVRARCGDEEYRQQRP